MSSPKPHKVIVYATCETVVSHDDPAEAGMIARKLFEDDISSKSEMFTVRAGRVTVSPYREKRPVMRTRAEISRAMRKRHRYAWGLWLQGLTLEQVGKYLNVTRSRVEQILNRYARMRRYRVNQEMEGDNWKGEPSWRMPLSAYRATTLTTNQFTPPQNPSIL